MLDNELDVQMFVTSMSSIITTYGFDGLDVDLEGQSLFLQTADTDFQNPTTPAIINMINALTTLADDFGPDFILTMTPETAYVQGGYAYYGGVWGAYLPLIHALRDRLTYVHVQHYNTGSMYGIDGITYESATADFHVAMAEMLMVGFPVYGSATFAPLPAEKVLIGLPASSLAAGSGYTPPTTVHTALNYLILGETFGGQYQLADPNGYFDFRGLMTWSVNWDVENNSEFALNHRAYLDSLDSTTLIESIPAEANFSIILGQNFPNPFSLSTGINYSVETHGHVSLQVYNMSGQLVRSLVDNYQPAGDYAINWDGANQRNELVSCGIYMYILKAQGTQQTGRMLRVK